jgi:choline dehydrogenase-like flavoprotein
MSGAFPTACWAETLASVLQLVCPVPPNRSLYNEKTPAHAVSMTLQDLTDTSFPPPWVSGDLCVVGGGIAGLLLAMRIARAGRKVVVLESGKNRPDPDIQFLNSVEDPTARYGRELSGRCRGLGGTSRRWGGRMISLSGEDTGERPHLGMPAWPIDLSRLDTYSDEIERLFGVANGPFEGEANFSDRDSLSTNDALNVRWAKCPSFRNCNLSTLLARELRQNLNLDIWTDATVCDFTLNRETGRLKSVTARNLGGKTLEVLASSFVLAAGTIETTRLLLLMDRCADNRIFGQTSVLGHYFQDHLKLEVAKIERHHANVSNRYFAYRFLKSTRRDLHLELPHEAQVEHAVGSAFAYVAMDLEDSPLAGLKTLMQGLQRRQLDWRAVSVLSQNAGIMGKAAYWRAVKKQLYVPPEINFKIMLCGEQLPHWKNRISLAPVKDRLGLPKAQLDWCPMDSEERTFRTIISRLAAYWVRTGLDKFCPLIWSLTDLDADMRLVSHAEACAHPSGTTRMGTDPKTSVVGADLSCHAVPNLSIVSASVFPAAGSANPTFTIMKMAYFFADTFLCKF